MSRFLTAMDRYCITVDTIVVVHTMMEVACVFSVHVFAVASQVMLVECTQLPYKYWYPRGYNFS